MAITVSDSSSGISESQIASTLPHLESVVRDQVTDGTPLLSFSMGQLGVGMRQEAGMDGPGLPGVIMGGRDIQVPVSVLRNTTPASYSGSDSLDVSHHDTDRYALFGIRQNSASINIIGRERRGNKGDAQIYHLFEGKVSRMVEDLRDELTRQIISDGTGNGGKDLDGLETIIDTGTLAGLAPGTYESWQPGGKASTDTERHGINTSFGSFNSNNGTFEMNRIYDSLSTGAGGGHPDALFVGHLFHRVYERWLTDQGGTQKHGQIQYTQFNVGNYGFQALAHKGVPLMWDWAITDGTCYFLNSKHFHFVRDSEGDFSWLSGDMEKPIGQDILVRSMIVEGNTITDRRRSLGKMTGVTA